MGKTIIDYLLSGQCGGCWEQENEIKTETSESSETGGKLMMVMRNGKRSLTGSLCHYWFVRSKWIRISFLCVFGLERMFNNWLLCVPHVPACMCLPRPLCCHFVCRTIWTAMQHRVEMFKKKTLQQHSISIVNKFSNFVQTNDKSLWS